MSLGASIAYRIGLEGAEEIKAKLDSVGQSGERAGQRMARGAQEAKNPFEELSKSIEGLQRSAGGLMPSFRELAEVSSAVGFVELARSAAEATRALGNQAMAFGLSTEALEKWKYAATQVGVSEESFVRGMTRFVAALGQAREAQQKLQESAGLLVEKQTIAEETARQARDQAAESADRSRDAIVRSTTAFEASQLTLQKSSEAYDRLRASTGAYFQAVPIGTLATDKSVIAHQRLAEAQETVELNTRRLTEAQRGIADAVLAANRAQEHQLILSQQQALEQDKEARAAAQQHAGPLGAFEKLGLDPSTLGDTEQALGKVIAAIGKISDATERAAILRQIYGRGWAENAALIKLNQDDIEKLGLQLVGVTEDEKKFAEDFNRSWSRLSQTFEGVKNAVGNILGQALVPLFNSISDFFLHNAATIREWSQVVTSVLMVFGQAVQHAGTVVGDLAQTFDLGLKAILEPFNALFGTDAGTKDVIAFAVAIVGLTKAFTLMRTAFILLNTAMGPWGIALTAISLIVIELIKHFDQLKAAAEAVAKFIGFNPDAASKAAGAPSPAVVPGFAGGGLVRGPGTGTSDSIRAWLSDGEFVMPAAPTRMWLPVLESMRTAGTAIAGALTSPISRPNHFAAGGLVVAGDSGAGSLSQLPRELMSAGGFAAVNVRFEIAGKTFPSTMHKRTANELIATAREQKLLSAGRQQSWKTE